jgi:hypothetical protein
MLKLSIAELEAAFKLIRKTSHDFHVTLSAEPQHLRITFLSADNEVCNISIFDEETKAAAKITSTTTLMAETVRRKL